MENVNEVIFTERLMLRHWREDDAADLYNLAKDAEIGPKAGWPVHTSVDFSRDVIRNYFQGEYVYAVLLKDTETIIGCCGANRDDNCPIDRDDMILGYWIGSEFQNRGYATEAARAVIDVMFEDDRVKGIWCGNFVENYRSANVQKKLGFKNAIVGRARDWGMPESGGLVENRYISNPNYDRAV